MFAQQVRKADAENAVVAELCLNRTGEALRHVGTATVVRDLELLSRVIEGPEKPVNFWGFRYVQAENMYHSTYLQLDELKLWHCCRSVTSKLPQLHLS